jgi:ubiquitin carboxyl-terminal hydrolase L3
MPCHRQNDRTYSPNNLKPSIHTLLTSPFIIMEVDNPDVPATRKAFVPLENSPEVMNSLVHTLGLTPNLQFHDVYSLTDPDLLSFLPRPAAALLLVFPVSQTYEKFRFEEDKDKPEYEGSGPNEEMVWFKQTIRNACGLIGLLHSVTNGEARKGIVEGSDLHKLLEAAIPLKPVERAELLYNSQALETAHASAAAKGDSTAPQAEANVDLHFVAFVKSEKGELWELDGRRKGPLMRGKLGPDDDVLSEKGQELGVQAFLKREEQAGGGDLRFSVIMLGPSMD